MPDHFSLFNELAQKAMDYVQQDLASLRTGKASVQMLDNVRVEAYGTVMKINELANVSAPDANMLVVKPWDSTVLEQLERAIATASLNINPVVDGDIIRITVPPLTEESRQEMVKLLYKKIESGKVMMRSIRTDVKKEIEDGEGQANVSKDDIHRDLKELDELTQGYIDQLDQLAIRKKEDLLRI